MACCRNLVDGRDDHRICGGVGPRLVAYAGTPSRILLLLLLSPPIARPVSTAPQPVLGGSNQTFVDIAKSVKPAVVNIYATKSGRSEGSGTAPFDDPLFSKFFGDEFFKKFDHPKERKERGLGSGVIVESNGTHHHQQSCGRQGG